MDAERVRQKVTRPIKGRFIGLVMRAKAFSNRSTERVSGGDRDDGGGGVVDADDQSRRRRFSAALPSS